MIMKFFKRGIEFNNLAKGFNGIYVLINELEVKIQNNYSSDYSEFEQDLMISAYLCRKEILDRMEEYHWEFASLIIVPLISKGRIPLTFAFQKTVGRLYSLAEKVSLSDKVKEILEKEDAFYEIDRSIPNQIKNMLN